MTNIVHAAVAVIKRADGKVLLAQRPEGKSYAGWWEFPGGKIEDGETPAQALARELVEELGIHVVSATPWIVRRFTYPERTVKLHFFIVRDWQGEPYGREGQQLSWQHPQSTQVSPMLPANEPVLDALSLPDNYAITNLAEMGEAAFFTALEHALASGLQLIQVREKQLDRPALEAFVRRVVAASQPFAAKVVVNGGLDLLALVKSVDATGLHLPAGELMALRSRPEGLLLGASCHNAQELAQAAAMGVDYVLLGAVQTTLTHPGAAALGWKNFSALVTNQPMPVYALGGMTVEHLPVAWSHGAHGIAMLRGSWNSAPATALP